MFYEAYKISKTKKKYIAKTMQQNHVTILGIVQVEWTHENLIGKLRRL